MMKRVDRPQAIHQPRCVSCLLRAADKYVALLLQFEGEGRDLKIEQQGREREMILCYPVLCER